MKAYFVRHGQTNYNVQGLCNDDPARPVTLTASGIRQAETVAQTLRAVPLQQIIVSELPRTRQTADIINRYHQAPIRVHAGINDIRSGFDGDPVSDYFQAIAADPVNAKANGGESRHEHRQRIEGFLHWLESQSYHTVLVVAHEETLRAVAAYCGRLSPEAMCRLQFDNCQVLQFELRQSGAGKESS
jgi:broad specificity phosphatase PhoE